MGTHNSTVQMPSRRTHRRQVRPTTALLVASFVLVVVAGCGGQPAASTPSPSPLSAGQSSTSTGALAPSSAVMSPEQANCPEKYDGQTVTLAGTIQATYGFGGIATVTTIEDASGGVCNVTSKTSIGRSGESVRLTDLVAGRDENHDEGSVFGPNYLHPAGEIPTYPKIPVLVKKSPDQLLLTAAELPAGYVLNPSVAPPPPGAVNRQFVRRASAGPAAVLLLIFVNDDVPAARATFQAVNRVHLGSSPPPKPIADESYVVRDDRVDTTEIAIVFRYTNVVELVSVIGARDTVTIADVMEIADRQLAKIQAR